MKPMIKYRGGKSKEIQFFEEFIPQEYNRYFEPFLGGGALFFHLEPQKAIIGDINTKLIKFYLGVKNDYERFENELKNIASIYSQNRKKYEFQKTKSEEYVEDPNEELYYMFRDMYNGLIPSTYSDAALYYFINKTAFSGMIRFNAKGEFNVPYGRHKTLNINSVTKHHQELLSNAEILNADYRELFKKSKEGDFMFLDPPYDCIFSDYGNSEYRNGFLKEHHEELAKEFKKLKCKCLMVISKTPLIERLYKGYIKKEYEKKYAVKIRNRFKSEATHLVITNY